MEGELSPMAREAVEQLLLLTNVLLDRLNLNSRNSSIPPSADQNREKKEKGRKEKKPGGQKGHEGKTLQLLEDPDEIKVLTVDPSTLPEGEYTDIGYERRQIIDIKISRSVIEFRAQVLENQYHERFVAPFPEAVSRPVQYGATVKAHSVYLSQSQLIPYDRVREQFLEQNEIPISTGTIFNFSKEAYCRLETFEWWVKQALLQEEVIHTDETGININGKRLWLHCASSLNFTCLYPHPVRGKDAMDEMGVLPKFKGIACHDHWKPYYRYDNFCHSLCNAHHVRELERAWDHDNQHWAKEMKTLLLDLNQETNEAGGMLPAQQAKTWIEKYHYLLDEKADIECPPPDDTQPRNGKRGRVKRSKSRNLLERLRNFSSDVLRFVENKNVPFTNNQGENDIRMTKVQQKISGCFRSMEGARIFCRIRSYLSTCRKQGISPSKALNLLFEGRNPDFMDTS